LPNDAEPPNCLHTCTYTHTPKHTSVGVQSLYLSNVNAKAQFYRVTYTHKHTHTHTHTHTQHTRLQVCNHPYLFNIFAKSQSLQGHTLTHTHIHTHTYTHMRTHIHNNTQTRLQVCNHPYLFNIDAEPHFDGVTTGEDIVEASGKMQVSKRLLVCQKAKK